MFKASVKREQREAAIRSSLIMRLKEAVQSVLQPGGGSISTDGRSMAKGPLGPVIGHSDNTNALCNVLEAILIHGLRDSITERMSSLLGSDPDRMPVPNFWPVILVISHRDLMEQVGELSFIISEVGRSRAWVRLALNQGQMSSYLSVLLNDTRTLKEYYRTTSLMRDSECSDIVLRVLQPVSSLTFNLATNAAVLNTWTQTPLVLAGLWAPAVQPSVSDPVLAATDVASTVYDDCGGSMAVPIIETPICDKMFDMIIGGTPETSFINDAMEKSRQSKDLSDPGNSEDVKDEPSETVTDDSNETLVSKKKESTRNEGEHFREDIHGEASFTSSWGSNVYVREWSQSSMSQSIIEDAPEYDQLFSGFESVDPFSSVPGLIDLPSPPAVPTSRKMSVVSSLSDDAEKLNYEVLPQEPLLDEKGRHLLPLLTRLTTEEGLDAQEYQCHQCKSYIGMIYGKPRLCSYDSKYYCYECHEGESVMIPSRLIHNWDMNTYPVCTANSRWLAAVQNLPLIDIRTVNPRLYSLVENLAEMQMLRTQLLYVRAYLFTCRTGVGEVLRKLLWPREHMYEHVHLYSFADLQLVAQGQLVSIVRKAVTFGRDHVTQCEVCSPRGFICELCDDKDIIYPFQLGSTHTHACKGICVGSATECTMEFVLNSKRIVLAASGDKQEKKGNNYPARNSVSRKI